MVNKSISFIIPILFFSGLLIYLVAWNLYYSFTNWTLIHPIPKFVGFETYTSVITSPIFIKALLNPQEFSPFVFA